MMIARGKKQVLAGLQIVQNYIWFVCSFQNFGIVRKFFSISKSVLCVTAHRATCAKRAIGKCFEKAATHKQQ